MNGITEKKWFIYIVDHHEGPFSLEDLQGMATQGQISTKNYAWKEGMRDWQCVNEIAEFNPIFQETHESPSFITSYDALQNDVILDLKSKPPEFLDLSTHQSKPRAKSEIDAHTDLIKTQTRKASKLLKIFSLVGISLGIILCYNSEIFNSWFKSTRIRAGMVSISHLSQPYLLLLTEKIPYLSKWISPIPNLEDVNQTDFEELKSAARDKIEVTGPRFGLVLSKNDLLTPFFYVSSNLQDGARFRLKIIGNPDTLLNQLSFETQTDITLTKKLGKTIAIRALDDKPIPRGEYVVYLIPLDPEPPQVKEFLASVVTEIQTLPPELPRDTKVLIHKTYFLGGDKDASYISGLKEFHDKMRDKTFNEISEVKQFTMTMESQLVSTLNKFASIKKGKVNAKQRREWEAFHHHWNMLQAELNQIIEKWTPNMIQKEYFYGALYLLIQQTGQAIDKVHGFHRAYFNGTLDSKTLEIQIGEASALAQTAISILRTKTDQVEKLPLTLNGLPRRDGL